jgi:hypothetical protein
MCDLSELLSDVRRVGAGTPLIHTHRQLFVTGYFSA